MMQLEIDFAFYENCNTSIIPNGTLVKRKSDGVLGYIKKFGHTFGYGKKKYNAYHVIWVDGCLGYPSEYDFDLHNQEQI